MPTAAKAVSPEQAQVLINAFEGEIKKVPAHAMQAHASDMQMHGIVPDKFCSSWPQWKTMINAYAVWLKLIPKYGDITYAAVNGLVAMADSVYAAGCPVPTPAPTPPAQ